LIAALVSINWPSKEYQDRKSVLIYIAFIAYEVNM